MDEAHLTPRQREVLVEVCKGRSNKEVARTLGMAEATVKLHLTEIFKTLGVTTRTQAIIKASGFPVTTPPPLTNEEILRTFTNTTFSALDATWDEKVLQFGYAIEKKTRA